MTVRPPALREGDRVRVVAPSGPVQPERLEAGLAVLRERYEVVVDERVLARHRFNAGPTAHRREALERALGDPASKAVFCARGGDGAIDLLPGLRIDRHHPQLLVGFSDITALHLAWFAAERPSVHGPVVTQLGELGAGDRSRLVHLLESTGPAPPISGAATVVGGTARGRLVGGNLAILTALVGTPYLPSLAGCLLLLEDIDERPYRINRMWTQLTLAGALEGVRGVVLGDFTSCDGPGPDHTAAEILAERAQALGVPCASGFAIGHAEVNLAVPLGVEAELDADAAELRFADAPVV